MPTLVRVLIYMDTPLFAVMEIITSAISANDSKVTYGETIRYCFVAFFLLQLNIVMIYYSRQLRACIKRHHAKAQAQAEKSPVGSLARSPSALMSKVAESEALVNKMKRFWRYGRRVWLLWFSCAEKSEKSVM